MGGDVANHAKFLSSFQGSRQLVIHFYVSLFFRDFFLSHMEQTENTVSAQEKCVLQVGLIDHTSIWGEEKKENNSQIKTLST